MMSNHLVSLSPYLSPFQTRMNTEKGDKETSYVKSVRIRERFASHRIYISSRIRIEPKNGGKLSPWLLSRHRLGLRGRQAGYGLSPLVSTGNYRA